jgi:hypothetical protein
MIRQRNRDDMADEALFIGCGEVVRGFERKAVEVFNEALQYYGGLQQDGKVERVEARSSCSPRRRSRRLHPVAR